MGTLYLDQKDTELRHEGATLVIFRQGERTGTVPLGLLERVVIRGSVTLSSGTLGLLADKGVGVLVLSGSRGRHLATLLGRTAEGVDKLWLWLNSSDHHRRTCIGRKQGRRPCAIPGASTGGRSRQLSGPC